jgi:hypothetical protein
MWAFLGCCLAFTAGFLWRSLLTIADDPSKRTTWFVAGVAFHCQQDAEHYRQFIEQQSGVDVGIGRVTTTDRLGR